MGEDFKSELVIGLVAPIGVNLDKIVSYLNKYLRKYNYKTNHIKITDALHRMKGLDFDDSSPYRRYSALMNLANLLRKEKENDILALSAIYAISLKREEEYIGDKAGNKNERLKPLQSFAHIIHSLKHPEEVRTLRKLFGSAFFLIGVHNSRSNRKDKLMKGMTEDEAEELIKRDEREDFLYGQRTSDVFQLADVFISIEGDYKYQIGRILDLIFGHPFITPTREEFAMYVAYAASWRSADLSRQVGAVITKPDGEIIATGTNDVPKYGGGQYWEEFNSEVDDHRDYRRGFDSNLEILGDIILSIQKSIGQAIVEREKFSEKIIEIFDNVNFKGVREQEIKEIIQQIENIIVTNAEMSEKELLSEGSKVLSGTGLLDITEYGRIVHAEMEALLSCSRIGVSLQNCIIYSTTFPCHNCAKHIIVAGVKKVVFIEPYPKSKAVQLHGDAMCVVGDDDYEPSDSKVKFEPFVGIGPRRFMDLFSMRISKGYDKERKINGTMKKWKRENAKIRITLEPLSYIENERHYAKIYGEYNLEADNGEEKKG